MNTIGRISRRKCGELKGLKMSRFSDSFVSAKGVLDLDLYPEYDCSKNNTCKRLSRRKHGELKGLIYLNIYNSIKKSVGTITELKFISSSKYYKRILNVFKKYKNEMRW